MKNLKQWCIENDAKIILELYENASNTYKSHEIGFSASKKVKFKCKNVVWNGSKL